MRRAKEHDTAAAPSIRAATVWRVRDRPALSRAARLAPTPLKPQVLSTHNAPRADRPVKLLGGFDNVDARERQTDDRRRLFDGVGPVEKKTAAQRRHEQCFPPRDGRKQRLAQQFAQLPLRIGAPVSERRAIDASPDAAARRDDENGTAARIEDAPRFLK